MTNEAVLIYETEMPIPFTCADGVGIEKGAILKISDPMTAAIAATSGDLIAGIAATEKIASDGKTKVSVYRGGIFKVIASGSITVGDALASAAGNTADTNKVRTAVAADVASKTIGIALETATTGESFLMELKPGVNNKAYA